VCADEGAAQLTEQGWHVETDKSGLSFG
jgi:hypothetical protein